MKAITSNYTRWKLGLGLVLIIFAAQLFVLLPKTNAATLATTMVRLDRLAKSATTTGTVCAAPAAAGTTEGKVVLTFPAGFTVGASALWTTNTTNSGWPTGASAWPTIQATGTAAGQVVSFTSGDLPLAQMYCFNFGDSTHIPLTNPSTTGSKTLQVDTQTGASAAIDTGTAITSIVDTNCSGSNQCDQIQVSAQVAQSFTFTLGGGTTTAVNLGTLTSAGTASSAINAAVSTNAKSGWQMWASDSTTPTPGLKSTSAGGYTIPYYPAVNVNSDVVTAGSTTEGVNLGADALTGTCNGTTSVSAKFASGGTSLKGGGLDGTLRTIANASSTANNCTLPLKVNAASSGTTPAATDYAGIITVVAAGLF